MISAGFREAGEEGRTREAELRAWLRDQPIRVLGPNCLGWIRPARRPQRHLRAGHARAGRHRLHPALRRARRRHPGLGARAPHGLLALRYLGNQADLNESDLLDAVAADPETRVIAGYLEGVADGLRFLGALRARPP